MKKIQKSLEKRVFFNASVIIAGMISPRGGSAKLLRWTKQKRIHAMVSELILDEVTKNAHKIHRDPTSVREILAKSFLLFPHPNTSLVDQYGRLVSDAGDAHVLASCKESRADFLVTLDKKHLLILQDKIKHPRIVSPRELLGRLSK